MLDDLGTESATPWAREKLFQLLNFRYNALLPTVITTSSEPKQIDPWLRTRMMDVNRCQYAGDHRARLPRQPQPAGAACPQGAAPVTNRVAARVCTGEDRMQTLR